MQGTGDSPTQAGIGEFLGPDIQNLVEKIGLLLGVFRLPLRIWLSQMSQISRIQ